MVARIRPRLPWSVGLLFVLSGCCSTTSQTTHVAPANPVATLKSRGGSLSSDEVLNRWTRVVPVSYNQPEIDTALDERPPEKPPEKRVPLAERLQLPRDLPGSDAPEIKLPEITKKAERNAAIDRNFPPLPSLPDLPRLPLGPHGEPVSLEALEHMAQASSPRIRQASAFIDAAQGVAIQVGLCPNPRFGYQGDAINESSTAGQQGAFIEQSFKSANKLQTARSAAEVDVATAELALQRTAIDVKSQVRRGYFSVLAAERSLRVTRAFAVLTTEIYTMQVTRLRLGQAAPYEVLQARVLARQARAVLLQAENRHSTAWKQLAATLGRPEMTPVALAGDLDRDVPRFQMDDVLKQVLANHPDVHMAENERNKAQLKLRLAEVTPIPDIDLHYQVQYDNTARPNNAMHGVSVGVQLPLWNRNQGGIREAVLS